MTGGAAEEIRESSALNHAASVRHVQCDSNAQVHLSKMEPERYGSFSGWRRQKCHPEML